MSHSFLPAAANLPRPASFRPKHPMSSPQSPNQKSNPAKLARRPTHSSVVITRNIKIVS